MDDVPHFERYAARGATIRTDGVEGVEIDGEKTDVAHAHLLRALQLDDAASHIEADAHKAVRYETMKAAKAEKLMAKRAQRERARRERKKQVWAARDYLLSQPQQVTVWTDVDDGRCVDHGVDDDGVDDDDGNSASATKRAFANKRRYYHPRPSGKRRFTMKRTQVTEHYLAALKQVTEHYLTAHQRYLTALVLFVCIVAVRADVIGMLSAAVGGTSSRDCPDPDDPKYTPAAQTTVCVHCCGL